jgi:hypothetical protein
VTSLRHLVETLDLLYDAFGRVRLGEGWPKQLVKIQMRPTSTPYTSTASDRLSLLCNQDRLDGIVPGHNLFDDLAELHRNPALCRLIGITDEEEVRANEAVVCVGRCRGRELGAGVPTRSLPKRTIRRAPQGTGNAEHRQRDGRTTNLQQTG